MEKAMSKTDTDRRMDERRQHDRRIHDLFATKAMQSGYCVRLRTLLDQTDCALFHSSKKLPDECVDCLGLLINRRRKKRRSG